MENEPLEAGGPGATASELSRLQAITDAALAHVGLDELLETLLVRIRELLGVDTAAILLLDQDTNELVARAAKGLEEEVERGVRIPVGRGFAGRIAAERRPVVLDDVPHADVMNPLLRERGIETLLGVPLLVEGDPLGVLHVGSLTPREFAEADVRLLQLAGDRIALAIDHARLYEAERSARERAERTTEQVLQLQTITEVALAHLTLGDELLDELLERIQEILEVDTVAILLHDAETNELVARRAKGLEEEVERGVRIPVGRGFAGRIAAERQAVRIYDIDTAEIVNPILRQRGIRSLLGVPLLVEGAAIGVLHVGSLTPRRFSDDNATLLQLAADRIALALSHAQLYEREHRVAETLQRSLLPEALPLVTGAQVAARYLPGADEADVGGDWYDALDLRDGRVGLALGDVVSRGVVAASVMGQLRNAVRAYALEGDRPSMVLERVLRVVASLDRREMATLVYGVLDPQTGSFVFASAGHPPPLVIEPDGRTRLLEEARGVPLGAVAQQRYEDAHAEIAPGSTLVLYTDGLVERRDMWIAEGLDKLRAAAGGAPADTAERVCDSLIDAMLGGESPADDVALLAVRLEPAPGSLELELPAVADSLAPMRRSLRQWLDGLGAGEIAVHDILIATSEAAANAVEHAYGPADASFQVVATKVNGSAEVAVRDQGRWRPPRGHNRGRGTLLMQELMDGFEVSTSDSGTLVRLRRTLEDEPA